MTADQYLLRDIGKEGEKGEWITNKRGGIFGSDTNVHYLDFMSVYRSNLLYIDNLSIVFWKKEQLHEEVLNIIHCTDF